MVSTSLVKLLPFNMLLPQFNMLLPQFHILLPQCNMLLPHCSMLLSHCIMLLPQFNMLLITILLSVVLQITPSLTQQTNEFAVPAAASRQCRDQGQGTMF